MSAQQRRIVRLVGAVVAIVCLALAVYYLTAATGHPRVKHTVLFAGIAVVGGLAVWFSFPPRDAE